MKKTYGLVCMIYEKQEVIPINERKFITKKGESKHDRKALIPSPKRIYPIILMLV